MVSKLFIFLLFCIILFVPIFRRNSHYYEYLDQLSIGRRCVPKKSKNKPSIWPSIFLAFSFPYFAKTSTCTLIGYPAIRLHDLPHHNFLFLIIRIA